MRQDVVMLEKEVVSERDFVDRITIITSPPPQKYEKITPPGYHWFKIIPYEDGIIPYDMTDTILYFKRDGLIECYVRTNHAPQDLAEMGYAIPMSPVDIFGDLKVFCSTLTAEHKHDYYLIDFVVSDTYRLFKAMPNYTGLAIYLHAPPELKKNIVKVCLELKGKAFKGLDVSESLYDLVLDILKNHDCYRIRGLRPEDIKKTRVYPDIYALQITLLSFTKKALDKLKGLISKLTDVDIKWINFEKPWINALEKASNPIKDRFGKSPLTFTASIDALRNWLILPDCSICKCIPRGTVPAEVVSRNYGFRIGVGLDGNELKLEEEDFFEHCIIMNGNDDLLATITKGLGTLNPVIILAINDSISRILLQKGVTCTPYDVKDVKINPLDLYEQDYANALAEVLEILGGVSGCHQHHQILSVDSILHPWVSSDSGIHLLTPFTVHPHTAHPKRRLGCGLIKFSRLHLITLDNKFIKNANYTS